MRSPHLILETINQSAGKFAVFCNAGCIAIPQANSKVYSLLEQSVVQVTLQAKGGGFINFHPKVWIIKETNPNTGTQLSLIHILCPVGAGVGGRPGIPASGRPLPPTAATTDPRLDDSRRRGTPLCLERCHTPRLPDLQPRKQAARPGYRDRRLPVPQTRNPPIRTRPDEGSHPRPLQPTAAAPLDHGHRRGGQDPHAIKTQLTEFIYLPTRSRRLSQKNPINLHPVSYTHLSGGLPPHGFYLLQG